MAGGTSAIRQTGFASFRNQVHIAAFGRIRLMTLQEYFVATPEMTDDKFAKLIGTSRSAVTQYRRGTRYPRPLIMLEIERVTDTVVNASDQLRGLQREAL